MRSGQKYPYLLKQFNLTLMTYSSTTKIIFKGLFIILKFQDAQRPKEHKYNLTEYCKFKKKKILCTETIHYIPVKTFPWVSLYESALIPMRFPVMRLQCTALGQATVCLLKRIVQHLLPSPRDPHSSGKSRHNKCCVL